MAIRKLNEVSRLTFSVEQWFHGKLSFEEDERMKIKLSNKSTTALEDPKTSQTKETIRSSFIAPKIPSPSDIAGIDHRKEKVPRIFRVPLLPR